jgi:hypothetical protein
VSASKNNPKNDRAKREYLIYLKEAKQRCPATVEQVRHAIDRLEMYTRSRDFGSFNKDQAGGFKRALIAAKSRRSGQPISIATAWTQFGLSQGIMLSITIQGFVEVGVLPPLRRQHRFESGRGRQ